MLTPSTVTTRSRGIEGTDFATAAYVTNPRDGSVIFREGLAGSAPTIDLKVYDKKDPNTILHSETITASDTSDNPNSEAVWQASTENSGFPREGYRYA